MLSGRKYWQNGEPELRRLGQRKARLYDHEAGKLACLRGHQADLLMVFIEEVMHEVGAHRPHPQEHHQSCSTGDGAQERAKLEQG
jgi:hypothetical protein